MERRSRLPIPHAHRDLWLKVSWLKYIKKAKVEVEKGVLLQQNYDKLLYQAAKVLSLQKNICTCPMNPHRLITIKQEKN